MYRSRLLYATSITHDSIVNHFIPRSGSSGGRTCFPLASGCRVCGLCVTQLGVVSVKFRLTTSLIFYMPLSLISRAQSGPLWPNGELSSSAWAAEASQAQVFGAYCYFVFACFYCVYSRHLSFILSLVVLSITLLMFFAAGLSLYHLIHSFICCAYIDSSSSLCLIDLCTVYVCFIL
jgi:hypothetical protein